MSAVLPGQRAAQRPLRAAKASQAALGRAATGGGAQVSQILARFEDGWTRLTVNEDGVREEAPYEPGDPNSSEDGA